MEQDKIEPIEEAVSEIYEANSPRDNLMIQEAIEAGDRAEVLAAITEVNQSEQAFMEQVAVLDASPDEIQGLVERFQQEADAARAALELRLQEEVAKDTGMNVWPAKDGMAYSGPIIENDGVFQYQQVASKTLIAHEAEKDVEAQQKGFGWMRGLDHDPEQGLERGIGR